MFFDQVSVYHVSYGLQRMANTLSTEAPTEIGGNFVAAVEKRSVLCNSWVYTRIISLKSVIDHLLSNSLQAMFHKAHSV